MNAVVMGPTVVDLVDEVAATTPGRLAVHGSDATLSYAELRARAQGLAGLLAARGVRPGDLVGLCVERSAALVVGALGILMAGAGYVAIDPAYPDDRIDWMLEDSRAAAVVCDGATERRVGRDAIVLGPGGRTGAPQAAPECFMRPTPADAAYVVYTSGSTGQPKGVLVDHAALSNLVTWHRNAFALGADDRCTQVASPGFDAVIWEVWPTLAAGASLHVVPAELRRDPVGLRDWLLAKGITVTFIPTAVAEGMVQLSWPTDAALRFVLTGGDALGSRPPRGLPFTLVNNYGLSETAVVATSGAVDPDGDGPPSIGRPIAGIEARVLDERGEPVPPGTVGELVIGGVAVALGYLHRPALTAERFSTDGTTRRYRTGDLVRERPDGGFDFIGRLDDQLSIRGFRVEPGEVVAALNAHPAVEASVIVGVGPTSAQRTLAAYVVAGGERRPDPGELAQFLRASLPEYLVPSRFVWLDRLPLNAHGKVDRAALPPLTDDVVAGVPGPRGDHGPRTPVEVTIASVLSELLDVAEIGMDENFFLLGGHSMLGAQLIVRLENLFDVELSLRYLFDHPTLGEIAAGVELQMAGARVGTRAG